MKHVAMGSDRRLTDQHPLHVPEGLPEWVTAELIAHTIRVWQPYYAETLTPVDALEMIMGVSRLIVLVNPNTKR